jgi:hypothetical protein
VLRHTETVGTDTAAQARRPRPDQASSDRLFLMRFCLAVLLVLATGCSSTVSRQSAAKVAETAAPPPADESIKFPQLNQVKMELVPDHLLGKDFMPGGNLGTYKLGKIEYQQFLGKYPDAQKAAFSLLDWQKTLKPAKYLAHMGGYFGNDGDRPVYVFTKGAWIAGLVGLPEAKADLLARQFAMRF